MKCLVTGAAGFIGNALTKRLVYEGHQVTALIHSNTVESPVNTVQYITADITDSPSLLPVDSEWDVVFHCAAVVKDYGSKKMFDAVNLQGTKHLVNRCKNTKCFVFLGHIDYESDSNFGYYLLSKRQAEHYLLEKHAQEDFPVVIIRPGNVYGPGATTWVLRPLHAIKHNRLRLIENGKGLFHHTYIDNLIDALLLVMDSPQVLGESIDITDGDSTITWKHYFNDLARIAGKKEIHATLSKKTAYLLSRFFMIGYAITRKPPLLTPTAVELLTSTTKISIKKAEKILRYTPKIDYEQGIKHVEQWLKKQHLV